LWRLHHFNDLTVEIKCALSIMEAVTEWTKDVVAIEYTDHTSFAVAHPEPPESGINQLPVHGPLTTNRSEQ
jgi:hypothetical protein